MYATFTIYLKNAAKISVQRKVTSPCKPL